MQIQNGWRRRYSRNVWLAAALHARWGCGPPALPRAFSHSILIQERAIHAETASRGKMSVPALDEAEVQELRAAIKGRLLLPGQNQDARAVEEALRVWAVSPALAAAGRRPAPAVIVQPRGKWRPMGQSSVLTM